MNDRPLGCSVFYSTLLPYGFTLKLFTFSWAIEKCASIFVDKIDIQLKILWLSTFIDKLNLSIDNYRQISSIIDLSTTFSMIDFDRLVTSWLHCDKTLRSFENTEKRRKHSPAARVSTFPSCS